MAKKPTFQQVKTRALSVRPSSNRPGLLSDPGKLLEGAGDLAVDLGRRGMNYARTRTPSQVGTDISNVAGSAYGAAERGVRSAMADPSAAAGRAAQFAADTALAVPQSLASMGDLRGQAAALRDQGDNEGARRLEGLAAITALGAIPVVGKATKAGAKKAVKETVEGAGRLIEKYADPKSVSIEDWQWRPQEEVRADLGDLSEVPPHVVDFGNFMAEQSGKAAKGQMSPRDLIKAYGITRSSIQRQAIPLATAEKRGLKLDQLGLDMVRPEGAFAEWMGTPAGQAYLDAAERGVVHGSAIEDLTKKFAPFGFQNTLGDNLTWAAENLPQHGGYVPEAIAAAREGSGLPADWSDFVRKNLHGIDAAKAGFVGSMLGRGDLPTLDARQLVLQTGKPSKQGSKYQSRRGGLGSVEGVNRLSARMTDLNLKLPEELRPYYQHLAHHSVWDKVGDEVNTHADLMNAMRNYAEGGLVEGDNLADKYKVR
jgi:hypothetical protein